MLRVQECKNTAHVTRNRLKRGPDKICKVKYINGYTVVMLDNHNIQIYLCSATVYQGLWEHSKY